MLCEFIPHTLSVVSQYRRLQDVLFVDNVMLVLPGGYSNQHFVSALSPGTLTSICPPPPSATDVGGAAHRLVRFFPGGWPQRSREGYAASIPGGEVSIFFVFFHDHVQSRAGLTLKRYTAW